MLGKHYLIFAIFKKAQPVILPAGRQTIIYHLSSHFFLSLTATLFFSLTSFITGGALSAASVSAFL